MSMRNGVTHASSSKPSLAGDNRRSRRFSFFVDAHSIDTHFINALGY
jgi:hypothetical protein